MRIVVLGDEKRPYGLFGGGYSLVKGHLAPGHYGLAGYFTKAPDYGIFQVRKAKPPSYWEGGEPLAIEWTSQQPFNGFDSNVTRSSRVVLGKLNISEGKNYIDFVVVGKDSRSTGYFVGIDVLEFYQ